MSNVYAEKSMGIFEDEEDELEVEAKFQESAQAKEARTTVSYIGYHARKQLAFDMWCESSELLPPGFAHSALF